MSASNPPPPLDLGEASTAQAGPSTSTPHIGTPSGKRGFWNLPQTGRRTTRHSQSGQPDNDWLQFPTTPKKKGKNKNKARAGAQEGDKAKEAEQNSQSRSVSERPTTPRDKGKRRAGAQEDNIAKEAEPPRKNKGKGHTTQNPLQQIFGVPNPNLRSASEPPGPSVKGKGKGKGPAVQQDPLQQLLGEPDLPEPIAKGKDKGKGPATQDLLEQILGTLDPNLRSASEPPGPTVKSKGKGKGKGRAFQEPLQQILEVPNLPESIAKGKDKGKGPSTQDQLQQILGTLDPNLRSASEPPGPAVKGKGKGKGKGRAFQEPLQQILEVPKSPEPIVKGKGKGKGPATQDTLQQILGTLDPKLRSASEPPGSSVKGKGKGKAPTIQQDLLQQLLGEQNSRAKQPLKRAHFNPQQYQAYVEDEPEEGQQTRPLIIEDDEDDEDKEENISDEGDSDTNEEGDNDTSDNDTSDEGDNDTSEDDKEFLSRMQDELGPESPSSGVAQEDNPVCNICNNPILEEELEPQTTLGKHDCSHKFHRQCLATHCIKHYPVSPCPAPGCRVRFRNIDPLLHAWQFDVAGTCSDSEVGGFFQDYVRTCLASGLSIDLKVVRKFRERVKLRLDEAQIVELSESRVHVQKALGRPNLDDATRTQYTDLSKRLDKRLAKLLYPLLQGGDTPMSFNQGDSPPTPPPPPPPSPPPRYTSQPPSDPFSAEPRRQPGVPERRGQYKQFTYDQSGNLFWVMKSDGSWWSIWKIREKFNGGDHDLILRQPGLENGIWKLTMTAASYLGGGRGDPEFGARVVKAFKRSNAYSPADSTFKTEKLLPSERTPVAYRGVIFADRDPFTRGYQNSPHCWLVASFRSNPYKWKIFSLSQAKQQWKERAALEEVARVLQRSGQVPPKEFCKVPLYIRPKLTAGVRAPLLFHSDRTSHDKRSKRELGEEDEEDEEEDEDEDDEGEEEDESEEGEEVEQEERGRGAHNEKRSHSKRNVQTAEIVQQVIQAMQYVLPHMIQQQFNQRWGAQVQEDAQL